MTAIRRPLTLTGRDFSGFRGGVAAAAARWKGELDQRWIDLADLEEVARSGGSDLLLIPADWIAPLASVGSIAPLDDLLSSAPPDGWPDGWADSFHEGIRWDGRVWGVPFHDGPQLFVYRTDAYADPRERAGYLERTGRELVPPRTWAEFDAQARWFTRPDEDRWGTVLAGLPDGHNSVYDFVVQLRRFGGDVIDRKGLPAFADRAGQQALAWLRDLRKDAVDPRAHAWDSVQSGERFAAGEVTMMANWAGYAQSAQAAGPVAGSVGCALLPEDGRGSINAFWVLAATTRSAAEHGWGLVRAAASEVGDLATTDAGASGTRLSTWRSRDDEITRLFEPAHRRSRPLPALPEAAGLTRILTDLVDRVVWNDASAPEAMADALADATDLLSPRDASGKSAQTVD